MDSLLFTHVDCMVHIGKSLVPRSFQNVGSLNVSMLTRGCFLFHDVIILATLHEIQSLHNVVNDQNHQSERAPFLCLRSNFLQALNDSDPKHVRRSNSLPSMNIHITLIPDSYIFALIVETHAKYPN